MRHSSANSTLGRQPIDAGCYAVTAVAVCLGIFFRLKGLGKAPFTVDEYYLASSVWNLLEHGLPQFETGGYYMRGLVIQYLAAPFFTWFPHEELHFRLIPVVANALTIPPLFKLSRRVGGDVVACAVTVAFCLSSWETEFARFARMYAPFQAIFVWYVWFLYKRIVLADTSASKWLYALSFLAIFVYEGAIFLAVLNFLPLLLKPTAGNRRDWAISGGVFVAAFAFIGFNFRALGVTNSLPPDFPQRQSSFLQSTVDLPSLLITHLGPISTSVWISLSILALFLAFSRGPGAIKDRPWNFALILALLSMALFHQFGLLTLSLCLVFLFGSLEEHNSASPRIALGLLGAVGGILLFWILYWISQAGPSTLSLGLAKEFAVEFLNYPPIYSKVLYRWLGAMPVQTVAMTVLILVGLAITSRWPSEERRGFHFLVALVIALGLGMAILRQPYRSIRYTFFLYPLILLTTIVSISYLIRVFVDRGQRWNRLLVILAVALFMVTGEDFRPHHLWTIDSEVSLYRIGLERLQEDQYYRRHDFRAPAEFVNERLNDSDIVISMSEVLPYYLDRTDYVYINQRQQDYTDVAREEGETELWSNASLLDRAEELFDLLREADTTVWLIVRPGRYKLEGAPEQHLDELYGQHEVFESVSGALKVYRIEPGSTEISAAHLREL